MSLIYPSYIPSIANYIIFAQNKNIVFEMHDNYQKQTLRNRGYIYGANGQLGLHIPVHYSQLNRQQTRDIRIDNSTNWKSIHWKSIESAYRTSPFFEFYEDDLKTLFSEKSDELTSFNLECISRINECLDFKFNYSISETFKKKYDGKDYRFLIETKNNNSIKTEAYIQVFENKYGYLQNLSILDLLFNLGPETLLYIKNHPAI